jgi:hypothetical protein
MDFERHVAELRKEGCSGTEALAKARKEAPQAFAAYRNENVAKSDDSDYDALVDAEMHKGCPTRAIAAQRILQMHRKQIREVVTLG